MAPISKHVDSDEETSSASSTDGPAPILRRSKFEDEEDDSDVLESWDAAEDSEVEAEKAKKAAEAKAKADAEAAANKKSKSQRIEEKRMATMRRKMQEDEESSSEEEEDEAAKRERLRQTEQDSDLKHAEDLFGNIGINKNRAASRAAVVSDPSNPANAIDLSTLPIFNASAKEEFQTLRETLAPLLAANSKKPHYSIFMQEFTKQVVKDLPSDQVRKIAIGLTTLSNEKMKEEKAADKTGKKTKAAKKKVALVANRDASSRVDTTSYGEALDDGDDFM